MRVIPKGYHFKRILRKKTEKKADWRVRTRWSAKSGVQKAPTKRQVQKGNPHRTQTRSVASDHVRIQGASAHSAGPGFFCLSVCGFVGMVACCVAWSRGPMPNQVACCVVGLWGCGVCVCVFYWPRGSQKAPKICFVRQLLPKPNKNGTNIDHKWDQSGPGGGKGQPKINENMKKYKKRKRKEAK